MSSPTMLWWLKSSYLGYKNAELSNMLKQRGLPHSGTKAQMAERLRAFDETQ